MTAAEQGRVMADEPLMTRLRTVPFRALRWIRYIPEVGDRRGWVVYALVRTPLQVLIGMVGIGVFAFVGELSLVANRSTALPRLWIAATIPILIISELSLLWLWFERRHKLASGASPYAIIRIRRTGLKVRCGRSRAFIPWEDVIAAASDNTGFSLMWRPDGRLFGVHVSGSQSSLMPSGALPNDESMAAWINDILRGLRGNVE